MYLWEVWKCMRLLNISMLCLLKKKFLLVLCKDIDELFNYIVLVFKFIVLLKNFDIVIDMGDGVRFVWLVKYEMLIFNKINKLKYVIGCV